MTALLADNEEDAKIFHDCYVKRLAAWREAQAQPKPAPDTRTAFAPIPERLIDPASQQVMERDPQSETGAWHCAETGAVFIDSRALAKLIATADFPVPARGNSEPLRASPAAPGTMMQKFASPMLPSIVVDRCPATGGFYLDPGEITKLRALDYDNRMLDDEEYREVREGYTVVKSKHRGEAFGVFKGAPGIDAGGGVLKFRLAAFFNKPLPTFLVKSRSWRAWLTSFSEKTPDLFTTGNQDFDSRFVCTSPTPDAAKYILSEAICQGILSLSEKRIYRERCQLEITGEYLAFIEGPYAASTSNTVDDWEFEFWDKSEIVLHQLAHLVLDIEKRGAA